MRKGRGEIKKVGDLFEKYRHNLKAPQASVVKAFCEVAEELIGVRVHEKIVSYSPSTRTLSIRGGGPLKSEIKLHREEILAHLKGRLGPQNAPNELL